MKKLIAVAMTAVLCTACAAPATTQESETTEAEVSESTGESEAAVDSETADVLAQYDLTGEDVQFVANIFKQYNEGNDLGLEDEDYYNIELKLARMGADLGIGELALWVGEIYQGGHVDGLTEAESVNTAIEWWEKAVELGQPRGWTNIGLLYEHSSIPGGGENYGDIEYDMDKAIEYLTKADEAGDSKAPRYLALLYDANEDYENALTYFEKAAAINDTTAKYYVGMYYLEGKGTDVDYDKAYEYLYETATNEKVVPGVADARYSVGTMYENGLGVDADLNTAIEWYSKAAEDGSEAAAEALKRLGQ